MTQTRKMTNDGFLLIEDNKEPMTGKSAYYELMPTGREQNILFEGVPRKVPSKPVIKDFPIRYVYVNRNGEFVKNWYRDLRQIFKMDDGEATPVNDKGMYAITVQKIQFRDGRFVVDSRQPALQKFLDEHPENESNPLRPLNMKPAFRKVEAEADTKALFNKVRLSGKARRLMEDYLNVRGSNIPEIQGLIVKLAQYPNAKGLPKPSIKDYAQAYIQLTKFADNNPEEVISILGKEQGAEFDEIIQFITDAFYANVFTWKNDVTTGGTVQYSKDVIQTHNLSDPIISGFVAKKVSDRINGADSFVQFFFHLEKMWGTKEAIELKGFVDNASIIDGVKYGENNMNPFASKFCEKIRKEKVSHILKAR